MNTLILLNLAMLLLPRNRPGVYSLHPLYFSSTATSDAKDSFSGTETAPFISWKCIFCDPSLCLQEFKTCSCGFFVDDRNFCFKCKVCRNDPCYILKNDQCEDGYVCHSDFPRSTIGWYSKAGRCVRIEDTFVYADSQTLSNP